MNLDEPTLHDKLLLARRSLLAEDPLRHTFKARHAALIGSQRAREALTTEAEWLRLSPSYRAVAQANRPEDIDTIEANGLRISVPRATSQTGMGVRLRRGWLPWRDILSQRELGLGSVMIDIGANIGTTSIVRVITGDVQRVYAIEPEPSNFACLVQNVLDNRLHGFVLPDACAMSNQTGKALLRQASGLGAHHLLSDKALRNGRRDAVVVETWTLDDWVQARGIEVASISFVKVDTQGWEGNVLAGASHLLSQRHIAWVVEVSPKHLAAAGTPLADFLTRCEQHFTHGVDLKSDYSENRVVPIAQLRQELAYMERDPRAFTNILLYHAS